MKIKGIYLISGGLELERYVSTIENEFHNKPNDWANYLNQSFDYRSMIHNKFKGQHQYDIKNFIRLLEEDIYNRIDDQKKYEFLADLTDEGIPEYFNFFVSHLTIHSDILSSISTEIESIEAKTILSMVYQNIISNLELYFCRYFTYLVMCNKKPKQRFLTSIINKSNSLSIQLDRDLRVINSNSIIIDYVNSSQCNWNIIQTIDCRFNEFLSLSLSLPKKCSLQNEIAIRNDLTHRNGHDKNGLDIRPSYEQVSDLYEKVADICTKANDSILASNIHLNWDD
ncbi:MAG: hypothetical protein HRU28_17785 [Rhizobiales bacterium]|nr:hypothetical protein [Hyphomicrobiales bacterium]